MKRNQYFKKVFLVCVIAVLVGGMTLLTAAKQNDKYTVKRGAEVVKIKGTTVSWQAADKTPLNQRTKPRRMRPVLNFERNRPIVKKTSAADPVVQRSYTGRDSKSKGTAPLMPNPLKSFSGLNFSANGAGWPPDTTGDVGQTYFVQAVNTSIGIYRKSDGSLVSATTYDDFFAGAGVSGTPCDENNNGDPLVLYDQYAQRWFILDFSWDSSESDGSYFSIAVSKTSDPTGEWWMYAFRADDTLMNDYPKAGIWHDGIYITANMFQFSGGFQGVKVWALKKPDIYSGSLEAQAVFDDSWYAWSLLPSNAKGSTPPPSNAPNYLYTYDADEWGYSPSDVLVVFKYDVDWSNAANTTWAGPTTITAAAFSLHSTDIPQPGTSNRLDTLFSRLMYPASYRNYGTHESVFLSHLADVGGVAAMRWYEVRISGGVSSIYQQGTYAPDTDHRWMGSIAADKYGAVAMGYSVSSGTLYPSIRYAGRLVTDTAGELSQGEASLIEGTGSQLSYNRWGDYSTITIDPVDDTTFWYTQEYYSATGLNWQTRIGSFKLNSSSGVVADLNGDGNADILWRYYGAGGYNAVWLRGTDASAPSARLIDLSGEANLIGQGDTGIRKATALTNNWDMDTPIEVLRAGGIIDGFEFLKTANPALNREIALSIADPRSEAGAEELTAATSLNWKLCGSGDFNSDGKEDLVWRNTATGNNSAWLMNGIVRASVASLPAQPVLDWALCGTGDFNNDGKPDLVWRHTGNGSNVVWLMNGLTRTSEVSLPSATLLAWFLGGAGDFNGDGKPDLVFRHTGDGRNVVWYMDGVTRTGIGWLPTAASLNWTMAGIGDFNNDGNSDILWRNESTGTNAIWYMNGITRTSVEFLTTVTTTTWKIEN